MKTQYKGYTIKAIPSRFIGRYLFEVNGTRSVRADFAEPESAIEEAKAIIDLDLEMLQNGMLPEYTCFPVNAN